MTSHQCSFLLPLERCRLPGQRCRRRWFTVASRHLLCWPTIGLNASCGRSPLIYMDAGVDNKRQCPRRLASWLVGRLACLLSMAGGPQILQNDPHNPGWPKLFVSWFSKQPDDIWDLTWCSLKLTENWLLQSLHAELSCSSEESLIISVLSSTLSFHFKQSLSIEYVINCCFSFCYLLYWTV